MAHPSQFVKEEEAPPGAFRYSYKKVATGAAGNAAQALPVPGAAVPAPAPADDGAPAMPAAVAHAPGEPAAPAEPPGFKGFSKATQTACRDMYNLVGITPYDGQVVADGAHRYTRPPGTAPIAPFNSRMHRLRGSVDFVVVPLGLTFADAVKNLRIGIEYKPNPALEWGAPQDRWTGKHLRSHHQQVKAQIMAALNENAVPVAWMAMDGLFHDVFIVRGMMLLIYTDLNATDAYTLLAQWLSEDGDIKQRSGAPTPQEFENLDTAAHEAVRHHATD
ncbi:g4898 [Coccomyxa viridis]|uniref:G4898 protein n=1 Tax=Coccomyxa viridis TaxID=1274662 RepID=A0ABP1FWF8_9CHLO